MSGDALQSFKDIDVGAIAVRQATSFVKRRPVTVGIWIFGLVIAAFANGFTVTANAMESYNHALRHAQEVEDTELLQKTRRMQEREREYRNAKGWFWSCDAKCQTAHDRYQMARSEVAEAAEKRDKLLTAARQEVGIWSTVGVGDVRKSFWRSWADGKETAARLTMYDFFFAAMRGSQEESIIPFILEMVMKYVMNLTIGLIMSVGYFLYYAYCLIGAYGEGAASGLAFFLLVLVASLSVVGTYLLAIYGTVAGGGVFLLKQAAAHQVEDQRRGGRPQRIHYPQQGYGGGRVGGQRSHFD